MIENIIQFIPLIEDKLIYVYKGPYNCLTRRFFLLYYGLLNLDNFNTVN